MKQEKQQNKRREIMVQIIARNYRKKILKLEFMRWENLILIEAHD